MQTLLDGRRVREAFMPELIQKIKKLSFIPTLAIVQVGNLPDSTAFIRAKRLFAKKIGVREIHLHIKDDVTEEDLIKRIEELNADRNVHAVIVQLPLPRHIDSEKVVKSISVKKDADGLISGVIMPATARGIRELLQFYKIELAGKKVAVIGRSKLVGTPIAQMCRKEGATVTVCHKGTPDITIFTKEADIIISAVGKPGLITNQHVREGQVVIDVGITALTNADHRKLLGDVDFESVKDIVSAISPVPGGVGPMTVFALFENVVDLCY